MMIYLRIFGIFLLILMNLVTTLMNFLIFLGSLFDPNQGGFENGDALLIFLFFAVMGKWAFIYFVAVKKRVVPLLFYVLYALGLLYVFLIPLSDINYIGECLFGLLPTLYLIPIFLLFVFNRNFPKKYSTDNNIWYSTM